MRAFVASTVLLATLLACARPQVTPQNDEPRESTPTPSTPTPSTTAPAKVDAALAKWRERTSAFLDDSRSAATMLDNAPQFILFRRKVDSIQEQFSRIPTIHGPEEMYKKCKSITITCEVAALNVSLRERVIKAGGFKDVEKFDAICKKNAVEIRSLIADIESHPSMVD